MGSHTPGQPHAELAKQKVRDLLHADDAWLRTDVAEFAPLSENKISRLPRCYELARPSFEDLLQSLEQRGCLVSRTNTQNSSCTDDSTISHSGKPGQPA